MGFADTNESRTVGSPWRFSSRDLSFAGPTESDSSVDDFLGDGQIFWPLDPFEKNHGQEHETLKLMNVFNLAGRPVEPISVITPHEIDGPVKVRPAIQDMVYDGIFENVSRVFTIPISLKISPPTLLVESRATRRRCAEAVLRYLSGRRVRLIAVNSSGRRGWRLVRMGSFTEAVISLSSAPILVTGPKCRASGQIEEVLFPTSLSPSSRKTFVSLMKWAKVQNIRLHLYHLQDPLPPPMASEQLALHWESEIKERRARAVAWVQEAARNGIRCRLQFETGLDDLGRRILLAAKIARADLIVMHRYSCKFNRDARFLMGEASCPVLVSGSSDARIVHEV